MKSCFKLLTVALLTLCMVSFSCSKEDNLSPDTKPDRSTSTWVFASQGYTKGGKGASSQDNPGGIKDGDYIAVAVSTSGDGGDYGKFSGSTIIYSFRNGLGAGTYKITSEAEMVSPENTEKLIEVRCVIGTAVTTGSSLYISNEHSGGEAEISIDKEGKYHMTITEPTTLFKAVEVGGGVKGAEDKYSLTAKNIF